MIILFAGRYSRDYNRNKIILDGLKQQDDVEVIEYEFRKRKDFDLKKFKSLDQKVDFIYCPSFSHKFVRLIKRHATKPVVFDPLISNYLTKVFDYKNVSRWSPRAYKNFLKDKRPFKAVDLLIADTEQHKKYYHKTFGIALDKIKVIPVGVNTTEFYPQENAKNEKFTVGFYGGFIPLQGTKFIIEAANILKENLDVQFSLIGTGYQWEEMKQKVKSLGLTNVNFQGWIAYDELPFKINEFDVCLGIFGDTPKAQLVIPNKIFHYAAIGKPIITMNSPAIKEIFQNDSNIVLIENTGKAIAKAILDIRNDRGKASKIGQNSRLLVEEKLNEGQIASQLISALKSL